MRKHKTVQSMKAADLVIHGTFDLRRALDQCAHPVWHPVLPASWPGPLEAHREVQMGSVPPTGDSHRERRSPASSARGWFSDRPQAATVPATP